MSLMPLMRLVDEEAGPHVQVNECWDSFVVRHRIASPKGFSTGLDRFLVNVGVVINQYHAKVVLWSLDPGGTIVDARRIHLRFNFQLKEHEVYCSRGRHFEGLRNRSDRYWDLFDVVTCEREIRDWALSASPIQYSLIQEDCFVFALNFIRIAARESVKRGFLTPEKEKDILNFASENFTAFDGSSGAVEAESRKTRFLGAVGNGISERSSCESRCVSYLAAVLVGMVFGALTQYYVT